MYGSGQFTDHSSLPRGNSALKRAISPSPASPIKMVTNESPLKVGKLASSPSVSDIVKQRLSLTASPTSTRSAARNVFSNPNNLSNFNNTSNSTGLGIYSASSVAQSTRRLSLGGTAVKLNSYGQSTGSSTASQKRRASLGPSSACANTDRIKVCVRKRPLSERENHDILECSASASTVAVLEERVKLDGINRYIDRHEFRFDRVFDVTSSNREIYESVVQQLVDTVVAGGRATCFAYGQTGSGKTHTMLNAGDGLYHLAADDLMTRVLQEIPAVSIHVAFYEIYQNSLYDLLNGKRRVMACEGKHGEVHIVGLTEIPVVSVTDLQAVMYDALTGRSTGSTAANSTSSRSHAILQFILKRPDGSLHGKFSFIDLAGSERGSDRANVDKQTKLEGAEINKSLLALKECIRAIDQDSSHLPFRQSRLTLVLKDSFVGDAKTCMIATVSPAAANCEHTINTLRYADRVKELKGPSGVGSEEVISFESRLSTPPAKPVPKPPIVKPTLNSPLKTTVQESMSITTSPIKINEIEFDLDDTFLKEADPATLAKKREKLHQSIAVLYDRVSSCKDLDLIELLQDELDGLLSAFSK